MELHLGEFTVLEEVGEAVPTSYKHLVVNIIGSLSYDVSRHTVQFNSLGDREAGLV